MEVVDTKIRVLRALGYEGTLSEMTLAWLQSDPAVSANKLREAWSQWLSARGEVEGLLDERWFFYLGAAGYTGSLADRERQFWEALGEEAGVAPDASPHGSDAEQVTPRHRQRPLAAELVDGEREIEALPG